jgi:chromosome segregation ATPase
MYGSSHQNQDAEKARQKNVLQREVMMQEIDFKRKTTEKMKLEGEVRALKNQEAHVRVSLQEKQSSLSRLDQDISKMDMELRDMRKKLSAL